MNTKPSRAAQLQVPESVIDLRTRRFIAAEADVSDPTFKRALLGEKVQRSSLRRIREALAARGLLDVLPPQPERDQ